MRSNWMVRSAVCAALFACAGLAIMAAPAAAQLTGNLRFTRGYDLVPNPPLTTHPTTLVLYGVYQTNCGVVEDVSVTDAEHVSIRLRSTTTCPDSSINWWSGSFPLGMLAEGTHTVNITLTMETPDSGALVYDGTLTFGVEDSLSMPPPPPPPPPVAPLVLGTQIRPWPPTAHVPLALSVWGFAPFDCPMATEATVIDSSHLSVGLSPRSDCAGDTTRAWSASFDLGLQREGYHSMDLAITLTGDSLTHHVPIVFIVAADSVQWGPPPSDSLDHMMSQARPNPFASESRFSVSVDNVSAANVAVFDIMGRRVRTIFSGRLQPGTTQFAWDGRHDNGTRATSGIYFYRLEMRGRVLSRRIVLLRAQ
jgi:FlgD Ig-like domain